MIEILQVTTTSLVFLELIWSIENSLPSLVADLNLEIGHLKIKCSMFCFENCFVIDTSYWAVCNLQIVSTPFKSGSYMDKYAEILLWAADWRSKNNACAFDDILRLGAVCSAHKASILSGFRKLVAFQDIWRQLCGVCNLRRIQNISITNNDSLATFYSYILLTCLPMFISDEANDAGGDRLFCVGHLWLSRSFVEQRVSWCRSGWPPQIPESVYV